MRENVPRSGGELPTQRNFNRMVDNHNRSSSSRPGSFVGGYHGNSVNLQITNSPLRQHVVIVKGNAKDDSGNDIAGCYLVNLRYYDENEAHESDRWKTQDGDSGYTLDGNSVEKTFSVGDKVGAYWDEQRQSFIPSGGGTDIVECSCRLVTDIPDVSGTGGAIGPWEVKHCKAIAGENPEPNPTSSVSVYNPIHFRGSAGGCAYFQKTKDPVVDDSDSEIVPAGKFIFMMVQCPNP